MDEIFFKDPLFVHFFHQRTDFIFGELANVVAEENFIFSERGQGRGSGGLQERIGHENTFGSRANEPRILSPSGGGLPPAHGTSKYALLNAFNCDYTDGFKTPRSRENTVLKKRTAAIFFTTAMAAAQTIQVDIAPGHATNHFVPNQTLGAGIDRIPVAAIDKDLEPASLEKVFEAGWQPVSYRQNTELAVEAWHWNPSGTWSDPSGNGYFTGSAIPGEPIRYSFGYGLPHRGFTRMTDGDARSYWKSNPYLTQHFTGESDGLHPQWVVIDLTQVQLVDSIRIDWAAPYATRYVVQYWTG